MAAGIEARHDEAAGKSSADGQGAGRAGEQKLAVRDFFMVEGAEIGRHRRERKAF